jgi:6-pyruvoyl tetrahydropterin synthase/QueD family protein
MIGVTLIREISAMHVLDDEPKCGRFHGHNYKFELTLRGEIKDGMVMNFDDIKAVLDSYDHRLILPKRNLIRAYEDVGMAVVMLNHLEYSIPLNNIKVIEKDSSTAENIAEELKEYFNKKGFECTIKLWETSNSFVEVKT